LKAFIKGELVPINKELSKKTRELFVATSDIEKLKEEAEQAERNVTRLRQEVAGRETDIFKQKISFEKDINTLQEEIEVFKKEMKRVMRKNEQDI
jgi:chromosome segregation ATPase